MPFPMPSGGAGGLGALGALIGPAMMLALALQKRGPVRTLSKAAADSPESARKAATLGLSEPPLAPLIRAGVVVRETDGRIWLNRVVARRRQWQLALIVGGVMTVLGPMIYLILSL